LGGIVQKLVRYLAYAAAAGVMLLALLVGIARLLLPLVPEYQEDIRIWAARATGLEVQFQHISASWPITGPEIQFLDVTIESPDDHQPVFVADRLDIGISLVRLLRDREVVVSRVGIEQTRVDAQRDEAGQFFVQGRPLEDFLPERDPDDPLVLPNINIELVDVAIAFRDLTRGDDWLEFRVGKFDLQLGSTEISLEGELSLPAAFGERVTVSADMPVDVLQRGFFDVANTEVSDTRDWNVYVTGDGVDVAQTLAYLADMPTPIENMVGNSVVWVGFNGPDPAHVTAELDFVNVELRSGPDAVDTYRSIAGRLEWARDDNGWLLAGSNLDLRRSGLLSRPSSFTLAWRPEEGTDGQRWSVDAEKLRLHDWFPLVRAVASEEVRATMLPANVSGDISDLDAEVLILADAAPEFDLTLVIDDLGIVGLPSGDSLSGISGEVVADQDGGRLQLDSDDVSFNLPKVFATPLAAEALEGFFVWRVTPESVRVLSDNVRLRTSFGQASSRFEMVFPATGDSPYLDLQAQAQASNAQGVVSYLPLRRFPQKVADWLERSITAGRATGADIEIRGPLLEYPFDHGEGVFRVALDIEDAVLDYAPGWPPVEALEGQLVFDGVGLYTRSNRAIYGGIPLANADVRIPDLRKGILTIKGSQTAEVDQVLGFLRSSPLADRIGPTLQRVSGSGGLAAAVNLRLPVTRPKEIRLRLDVTTEDAQLDLERLDFGLTKVAGSLTIENTKFHADALTAELFGEPVSIRMRPAEPGGLRSQFVTLTGRTPIRKWIEAFKLPQPEKFDGATDWTALVMFPARQEDGTSPPLHILVRSDLLGAESRMPAPIAKPADTKRALQLDVAFPEAQSLEVTGRLADDLTWALRFDEVDGRWRVERGGVHAGAAAALLPLEPGVELSGRLEFLRFDDWLNLAEGAGDTSWQSLYNSADLDVRRLALFGRLFSDVSVTAARADDAWNVVADGPELAGSLRLPIRPTNDNPAVLDLERLWLVESDAVDEERSSDPRSVIPVRIAAADFILGKMRFGALSAELRSTSSGVVADPISMQGETFTIDGNAAWLVHPNDDSLQQSRIQLDLNGSDIKAVLTSLGYDPIIEGKSVAANADLTWPGAPDGDFLFRASGEFGVRMEKGAVLSLEPGGGRLLGVLSVTALPRRLALDFRDVTDEGLGFDTLRGSFTLDDGNAYTCNLGLEGSVADMGIVGRTGLESEDYDQLAVVRPHVSNLLAIGGAVVGGPAGGAAMLIFSQIFRKPLSQLGESYYRVTGSWDDPAVQQLQGSEVNVTPLKNCETYLEDALARSLENNLERQE